MITGQLLPLSRAERYAGRLSKARDGGCIYCGETDFSPSVECWEMYDVLVCEDCADQAHDDNDQFGVGA